MAVQLSVAVRNARLDAIETAVGATPVLRIFTGAQPANCAAANSGTELWNETLPSDWAAAASSGSKALAGTWQADAIADGVAGHWRLYASDGTTCHAQGSCSETGGGGDMILENTDIATGQQITVTQFTLTDANA
jgi:hypothetical protein